MSSKTFSALGVPKPCGRLELLEELGNNLTTNSRVIACTVVGKSLYIKLTTKDLVVKVTPSTNQYSDHYSHATLQLLCSSSKIDEVSIAFSDVLERASDSRSDYDGNLYIWHDRGHEDWYIARPESLEPLIAAIHDYILTFSR